jgi:predicted P-loop ATPase
MNVAAKTTSNPFATKAIPAPAPEPIELHPLLAAYATDRAIPLSLMVVMAEPLIDEGFWPVQERLGIDIKRNYQTKKNHPFGDSIGFLNEDGSTFQVKPSNPQIDSKGKPRKYETPIGSGSRAYAPAVDAETRRRISEVHGVDVPNDVPFWSWVAAHPEIPIIFTEGPGKTGAGLGAGEITIGLSGCHGAYRTTVTIGGEKVELDSPQVIDGLLPYVGGGRVIHLAMDKDTALKTAKTVRNATLKAGGILEPLGCKVFVLNWNPARGKGLDDVLQGLGDGGADWLKAAIKSAPSLAEYAEGWRNPIVLDELKALLLKESTAKNNSAAIEAAATIDGLIKAITCADLIKEFAGAVASSKSNLGKFLKLAAMHFSRGQIAALNEVLKLKVWDFIGASALREVRKECSTRGVDVADVLADCYGSYLWDAIKEADAQFCDYVSLCRKFGDRLRYNELRLACELDGKPMDLDLVRGIFVNNLAYDPKSKAENTFLKTVIQVCKRHSYNPVADYLNRVSEAHGADTSILDGFALRYFGNDSAIAQAFIVKTLIAAVARVKKPGCKVDTVLVLQGGQGALKSTFFDILSQGFFDDSMGDSGSKDEILKAASAWIVEWAELNHVTGKKGIEKTKAFLTSRIDRIRLPYGRVTVEMPRSFLIVGSSNPKEILHDPTGDRRFWPLEVFKEIDIELLKSEADRIWAAAVALYDSGAQWWLTPQEVELANANNEEFKSVDVWVDSIAAWLENSANWDYKAGSLEPYVRIPRILDEVLKIEIGRQSNQDKTRVTKCLRQLGWEPVSAGVRLVGVPGQVRAWTRQTAPVTQTEQPPKVEAATTPIQQPHHLPLGDWATPPAPSSPKPQWRPTHTIDGVEVEFVRYLGDGKEFAVCRPEHGPLMSQVFVKTLVSMAVAA